MSQNLYKNIKLGILTPVNLYIVLMYKKRLQEGNSYCSLFLLFQHYYAQLKRVGVSLK
jgi:hypothetical protein